MQGQSVSNIPGKFFPWIFHTVLWTIWVGLPFLNGGDNPEAVTFLLWLLPVSLLKIPCFLVNTEWLIPAIFRRRGIGAYLISLIFLIAGFSILGQLYKVEIVPYEVLNGRTDWFWSIVPVLFVTAISTGYGFIVYLLRQEQGRQEETRERLTSELSFLRSQISPHFLFNILNSIVYLIRSNSSEAESVTLKLSELMRYMLYSPQQGQVLMEEEIGYLENYIALQRTRFGEDVDIRFTRSGKNTDLSIEPMILIPFVENAFKHGVGLVKDPIIEIAVTLADQQLNFHVGNKVGPDPPEAKDGSSGIGLKNVRRRLELLYPDRYELTIREEDDWFLVDLVIRKT
ncbi:MAG: histidine kinase [Bacteroidota bacterium]